MSYPQQPSQQDPYGGQSEQPGAAPNAYPSGQPGYLPGPPSPQGGSGLGWTSIVLAIVLIILGPLVNLLMPLFFSGAYDYAIWQTISYAQSGITITVAVVGVVLSAITVRRGRKVLGGIGLGAHGATIAGQIWYMLASAVISLAY